MRNALVALSVSSALFSSVMLSPLALIAAPKAPAKAATKVMVKEEANLDKKSQSKVAAEMLEKILSSIEVASIDVNIHNATLTGKKDEKTGEMNSEFKIEDGSIKGMLKFSSDWAVDLVKPSENTPRNAQIERLNPKLVVGAKDIILAAEVVRNNAGTSMHAEFFDHYDKSAGQWISEPLIINSYNQMNKSLLKIRLHAVSATARPSRTNPKVMEIAGECKSDKILFDFISGENRTKEVRCTFKGEWTDQGYKLDHITFENKAN